MFSFISIGLVGRADLLCCLFYLSAINCNIKAIVTYLHLISSSSSSSQISTNFSKKKQILIQLIAWIILSLIFVTCGFLSKEIGLMVLIDIIKMDVFFLIFIPYFFYQYINSQKYDKRSSRNLWVFMIFEMAWQFKQMILIKKEKIDLINHPNQKKSKKSFNFIIKISSFYYLLIKLIVCTSVFLFLYKFHIWLHGSNIAFKWTLLGFCVFLTIFDIHIYFIFCY